MKKTFITLPCIAILAGCASPGLSPQAAKVLVSYKKPPKNCKFMGQVMGKSNQDSAFQVRGWDTAGDYTQQTMDDLRTKASNLNANYVYILHYKSYGVGLNDYSVGNAYSCKSLDT